MKKTRLDKTKYTSPENRRLDALAKLLTGNSVCTAVTIADNKLLISTNLLSVNNANTLNSNFQSDSPLFSNDFHRSSKMLFDTLITLHKCSTEGDTPENVSFLSKFVCRYVMDKYLGGSVAYEELIQSLDKINNEYNRELLNKFITSFSKGTYDHDSFKNLFGKHNEIESQCKWGSEKTKITNFLSCIQKAYKDTNKILELLCTDKFPTIRNLIQEKAFILVGADKEPNIQKDPHAEMNLINYLIENELFDQYYIGISKLTCFGCANDIIAVNNNGIISIVTRGAHNVDYSLRRVEPTFQLEDIDYYRQRFEDLPRSEQGKTSEHADFSDSDVEVDLLG